MKRIRSIEELLKFEKTRSEQQVADGYMNEDDTLEWLAAYNREARKFWEENGVELMLVLEAGEIEDEEYALVVLSGGIEVDNFKMVYMSYRCNDVHFVMF